MDLVWTGTCLSSPIDEEEWEVVKREEVDVPTDTSILQNTAGTGSGNQRRPKRMMFEVR